MSITKWEQQVRRDEAKPTSTTSARSSLLKNFAEAARILTESPGAMKLRRLEALQTLTGSGVSKVIFDLARPAEVHPAAMAATPNS